MKEKDDEQGLDLSDLREGGGMQQVGAPLAGHNLIRLS
jgi:hypothetical protein